jgi:predicted enzyme related to lactoylglutathione lyase/quinol monooxygenase YgiN
MKTPKDAPVHLISKWIFRKGREKEGLAALEKLATEVLANEPGTLMYRVHTPVVDRRDLPDSLPASVPQEVVFYETYANAQAFTDHVKGPLFTRFVEKHGALFLGPSDTPGKPFIQVQFLELQTGFTREPPRVNGVALYRIEPGRLHGSWSVAVPGFDGKTGIEIAEKKGRARSGLPGQYDVRIWNPGTPTSQAPFFTGTLTLKALPGGPDPQMESYALTWTRPDSPEAYEGLGLRRKDSDQLTVSYWNQTPPGPTRTTAQAPTNRHPSVMFEIIARKQGPLLDFYRSLFGWNYQFGTGNFAYVRFPGQPQPLLGGIGQADPSVPGFDPGRNFYLLVEDLKAALEQAKKLGGSTYVDPVVVDGYHFAMMKDPEGNIVGLIEPFTSSTGPQGTTRARKAGPRKGTTRR